MNNFGLNCRYRGINYFKLQYMKLWHTKPTKNGTVPTVNKEEEDGKLGAMLVFVGKTRSAHPLPRKYARRDFCCFRPYFALYPIQRDIFYLQYFPFLPILHFRGALCVF